MRKRIRKLATSPVRLNLKEAKLRTGDAKLFFLRLRTAGESQRFAKPVRDERCARKESHMCPLILRNSDMQLIIDCFVKCSQTYKDLHIVQHPQLTPFPSVPKSGVSGLEFSRFHLPGSWLHLLALPFFLFFFFLHPYHVHSNNGRILLKFRF